MRLPFWVLLVALVALPANASSPADPKATKTLESVSELSAQNDIQDKRFLRGTGEIAASNIVPNLNKLMKKTDISTLTSNILKGKHIPNLKYLPFGKKLESWLLYRALRKTFPHFKPVKPDENFVPHVTTQYFEYFFKEGYKPEDVRKKLGSGKTIHELVLKYAVWIGQNGDLDEAKRLRLLGK